MTIGDAYRRGYSDAGEWIGEGCGDGRIKCPFGLPGDRLWVREAFAKIDGQTRPWIETDYRATYQHGDRLGDSLGIKKRWTPSIHMPRDASRIMLEITGVRVEHLQDITEADALAEGVKNSLGMPGGRFANENYAHLWDAIYGEGSWDANPWVWVIEFKRVVAPKCTCITTGPDYCLAHAA